MSRNLVAYFSITGVTEHVATRLARVLCADLFEVKASKPVPPVAEDGTTQGQPLTFVHKNIEGYDRIFVGLPIWWYAAPTVIHTFLSDYDLTGKTVIPFATSGGGGLDKVKPRLLESCPGADLREASLLLDSMTDEELLSWAEGEHR